jgi:hypothetical protein
MLRTWDEILHHKLLGSDMLSQRDGHWDQELVGCRG